MWLYKFFTADEHSTTFFALTSNPKDVEHTPSVAAERIAQGLSAIIKRDKASLNILLAAINNKLAALMPEYEQARVNLKAKQVSCMFDEIKHLVNARGAIECDLLDIKSCEIYNAHCDAQDAAKEEAATQAKGVQDEDEEQEQEDVVLDMPEQAIAGPQPTSEPEPEPIPDTDQATPAIEPQPIADTPIPETAKPQPETSEPHKREQIALF